MPRERLMPKMRSMANMRRLRFDFTMSQELLMIYDLENSIFNLIKLD
jgi:hypothetical protein